MLSDPLEKKIAEIRAIGFKYSFDGEAVADFLERLNKVVGIRHVELRGARLTVWVGEMKEVSSGEVAQLLSTVALLNVSASSVETDDQAIKIWFEWILPSTSPFV